MDATWNTLKKADPGAIELAAGDGAVLATPGIAGRLFLRLGDATLSRVDAAMAARGAPGDGSFYNVGGGSLWPAPEGGPFGFNYPGGADWRVQEGVNTQPYQTRWANDRALAMEKDVVLTNRAGREVPLRLRRQVAAAGPADMAGFAEAGVGYETQDSFTPLADLPVDLALAAPWTLEQFPLDGAVEIYIFARPGMRLNWAYYPGPAPEATAHHGEYRLPLTGAAKWQLGVPDSAGATAIAALYRDKGLLLLRRCGPSAGMRFDFADNDQPGGPWTAADRYSVFYGADMGFFELETVGAMATAGGKMAVSTLFSETRALKGDPERLLAYARRWAP